jgi:DNA topoisomerase-3
VEGWRAIYESLPDEAQADGGETDRQETTQGLPVLREGEGVAVERVAIIDGQTRPPRRFTEAGLIQAMSGIARFVQDPAIKKVLRETDGLGTPATQAQIIETLFDRGFIERHGRQIASTDIGRVLIEALPEAASRPDMTALWEAAIRNIAGGRAPLGTFIGLVVDQLRKLVTEARAQGRLRLPPRSASSGQGRGGGGRRRCRKATAGRR